MPVTACTSRGSAPGVWLASSHAFSRAITFPRDTAFIIAIKDEAARQRAFRRCVVTTYANVSVYLPLIALIMFA